MVVAHVNLLNVAVVFKGFGDRLDLLIGELVLQQVEVLQRQNFEQVGESLAAYFVVVDLDILELLALLLQDLNQILAAIVVDVVVRQSELLKQPVLLYELANQFAASRSHLVVAQCQSVQALPFLAHESLDDDLNSLVADVVSAEDELLDGSAQVETLLHRFNPSQADFIFLDIENFEVFFVAKGLAESYGSFRKNAVHRKRELGNVFLIQQNLADCVGTAGSNKVLREHQLPQRALVLD